MKAQDVKCEYNTVQMEKISVYLQNRLLSGQTVQVFLLGNIKIEVPNGYSISTIDPAQECKSRQVSSESPL